MKRRQVEEGGITGHEGTKEGREKSADERQGNAKRAREGGEGSREESRERHGGWRAGWAVEKGEIRRAERD